MHCHQRRRNGFCNVLEMKHATQGVCSMRADTSLERAVAVEAARAGEFFSADEFGARPPVRTLAAKLAYDYNTTCVASARVCLMLPLRGFECWRNAANACSALSCQVTSPHARQLEPKQSKELN